MQAIKRPYGKREKQFHARVLMLWQKYCKYGSAAYNLASIETGAGWFFFLSICHPEEGLSFEVFERTDFRERHVHILIYETKNTGLFLNNLL